jgi:drug/metabolite transporter (DMT)-like permease
MVSWLFVTLRIIANPLSNVFQKRLAQRSANPVFVIAATHALLTLACLPLLFVPLVLDAGWSFWANIVVADLLAVAGNALLVAALRTSDLSVLGPINAYKSVLGLILGIVLVHEIPTPMGAFGVLLILRGSYFVVDRDEKSPRRNAFVQFFRERGVRLRFAALAFSATEAIFLKKALLASSPLTAFVFWCILGLPIAALASTLLIRDRLRQEALILRQNKATYLWLAITTALMQFATLFTFDKLQVGYSLALFQLSTLLSVFFGYRYFQERNIQKRLLGSLIMVGGAVLIVVFGHG